jgi:CheY-like chemotaxis protein
MTAKRALVVDDSKSARAFLAKLLEEQQLEVDAATTAEQAIDYLTHNRPDVIFMDHLMPGMDGFQAVQAIKNNPRTAMIPILMYTSQEGELYLGQARALGAVGVLPKTIEPADVRTVLQQLHLVDQADTATVAVQADIQEAAVAAAAVASSGDPAGRSAAESGSEMLRDEIAALRRQMTEAFDGHAERLTRDVRGVLRELVPQLFQAPVIEPEPARHSPLAWILALLAGMAAATFGTLAWQGSTQNAALRSELADSRATIGELTARISPPTQSMLSTGEDRLAGVGGDPAMAAKVPFGEIPFGGARIEQLREFVARMAAGNGRGTVEMRRYTGRFCLVGSAAMGYTPADPATPYIKCDLVADTSDPALGNAEQETVPFANALAELRKQHAADIRFDVGEGRAESLKMPYPEIGGSPPRVPTAAEWNAAAESNNRVEIRWHPAT